MRNLLHDTELGSFLNASGAYCYELIYNAYQFFILIHSRLKLDKTSQESFSSFENISFNFCNRFFIACR